MPTERFQFTGGGATSSPRRWICRTGRSRPMRCSRIASPAARTCWRPSASQPRLRPKASRCCGSTLRGSAPARANLPTRPSRRTSPTSFAPPIICAKPAGPPAILIGHSLGGAAILAAAGRIPDAKAVVTIAAPSDPAHVTHLFKDKDRGHPHPGQGRGSARRPAVPHQTRIPRRYRRARPDGACRQAAQGAAGDAFADRRHRRHRQCHQHLPRRQASQEFRLAVGRRSSAEQQRDSAYVADVIAAWAERYVDPAAAAASRRASPEPRNVVVRETRDSKLQQTVTIRPAPVAGR